MVNVIYDKWKQIWKSELKIWSEKSYAASSSVCKSSWSQFVTMIAWAVQSCILLHTQPLKPITYMKSWWRMRSSSGKVNYREEPTLLSSTVQQQKLKKHADLLEHQQSWSINRDHSLCWSPQLCSRLTHHKNFDRLILSGWYVIEVIIDFLYILLR